MTIQTQYHIKEGDVIKYTGTLVACQQSLIGIYGAHITVGELAMKGVIIEPANT